MKKDKKDFESRLKRLQVVVDALEREEPSLEQGMALYKEGLTLVASCRSELQQAKHEITVFSEGVFKEFDSQEQEDA